MRTFRSIMSVIAALAAIVGLSSLATAGSETTTIKPQLRAVYPNYLLPGINQACPVGSQKVFRIELSVPRGERIVSAREFMLVLKGDVVSIEPERVSRRLVEYHYFPQSRKAKVRNLLDMRRNLAYVRATGYEYTMVLSKDCIIKEY